jgi:putative transposon-encoded protein
MLPKKTRLKNRERLNKMLGDKESEHIEENENSRRSRKVKFEVYGEEMIDKEVKLSGNSGRVYLPPNWVGHQVKIIRID